MKNAFRMTVCSLAVLATAASLFLLTSCNIRSHKDGEKEKVDIATPFGDMKVRTNETVAKDTGLPEYPGAKLKEKEGKNDTSANVNLSFGQFGLKVAAVKYTSDDAPEKILGFYRNELKRFGGNVIECKGGGSGEGFHITKKNNGSEPVSCDKDDHNDGSIALKIGTENNQHVVEVKPDGKGSQFTLVYVNARGGDEGKL